MHKVKVNKKGTKYLEISSSIEKFENHINFSFYLENSFKEREFVLEFDLWLWSFKLYLDYDSRRIAKRFR